MLRRIRSLLAYLSLLGLGLLLLLPSSLSAQEDYLHVLVNVYLQVEGQNMQAQSGIVYDVLSDDGQMVWEGETQDSQTSSLELLPGSYLLRLYDGGDFVREDQEIQPARVTQSIANLSDGDRANQRTQVLQDHLGQVMTDPATGHRVYELPFNLEWGEDLPLAADGKSEAELNIYLADESSREAALYPLGHEKRPEDSEGWTGSGQESEEETEDLDDPSDQWGSLHFTLRDDLGQPIPGVTVFIDEVSYQTDDQGSLELVEVPVGDHSYQIQDLPEGYQGELAGDFQVNPQEEVRLEGTLERQVQESSPQESASQEVELEEGTGELTFRLLDETDQPISGAQIVIDETTYFTDDLGEIDLVDVPLGNHDYYLQDLPEGYQGDFADHFTMEANQVLTLTARVQTADSPQSDQVASTESVVSDEETEESSGEEEESALEESTETSDPEEESQDTTGHLTFELLTVDEAPVANARIAIDDEAYTTDELGKIDLAHLSEGTHYYQLLELPQGYQGSFEGDFDLVAGEHLTLQAQVEVEEETHYNRLVFQVEDEKDQAIPGVTLTLDGEFQETTDDQGQAVFADLEVGQDYAYTLTYPQGYQGKTEGQVTLTDESEGTQVMIDQVQYQAQPGQASLTVQDDQGQVVPGAKIKFGGLEATTDSSGQVHWENLDLGKYHYSIIQAPEGYQVTEEEKQVEITEGLDFTDTLTLEKLAQFGNVTLTLETDQGQPVPGVKVILDGQEGVSDDQGQVTFQEVNLGEHTYSITEIPLGYSVEVTQDQVTVQAQETTQLNLPIQALEQDQEELQEDLQIQESDQVTDMKHFVDQASGVSIDLHPQDGDQVVRLKVETISSPGSLEGIPSQGYRLTLLGRDNQTVPLTKLAKVSLPLDDQASFRSVLRQNEDQLATILTSKEDQKAVFQTQSLGDFIVTYHPAASAKEESAAKQISNTQSESQVRVTKEESQEQADLPKTGEAQLKVLWLVAGLILWTGFSVLTYQENRVQK